MTETVREVEATSEDIQIVPSMATYKLVKWLRSLPDDRLVEYACKLVEAFTPRLARKAREILIGEVLPLLANPEEAGCTSTCAGDELLRLSDMVRGALEEAGKDRAEELFDHVTDELYDRLQIVTQLFEDE